MDKQAIAHTIAANIEGVSADLIAALLEYPANPDMGDLSLPCFKLSKQLRKSPQEIALMLKSQLSDARMERIEAVSGYLNLYFNKQKLAGDVVRQILTEQSSYGSSAAGLGKVIVLDYSAPNIAKPFHVGHLRSTVIGNALYRIFSFSGYQCVSVNHLGDWGTQFGKLITAYQHWGQADEVELAGIDELLHLYVKFHAEAELNPALEDEARAWFTRMEQGDEQALALWRSFVAVSILEFERIYELLGVSFDSQAGESFYNGRMEPVIDELSAKQLLVEDNGAMLVRLDDYQMAPALILKKDGSSLYHTRDITAALYRKETYGFDKAVYVTDYAQNLHFAQWFKVIELMGYKWAKDLIHVPFGRVSLEGASLSTRKGNVIKLEEVLLQAVGKIRTIIEEKNPQLANKEEVARAVGVGAVIFNDLSSGRIKDIDFNWEEALNFDGETGPYVQYTHVRTCSLLRKAFPDGNLPSRSEWLKSVDNRLAVDEEAFHVIKTLKLFPERIEQAMTKLEPSIVSRFLIDLAQAFNRYYRHTPILVEDEALRMANLALVKCVQQTLQNGLSLIGLQAPEQM